MEDSIIRNTKENKFIEIKCRSGAPSNKNFLKILSLDKAESIIVLASDTNDHDSKIIKTLLALKGLVLTPNNSKYKNLFKKTIAEIHDIKNEKIVEIISNKEIKLLKIKDFSAKIIAQTARQSGLPKVYEELLDYEYMEIYFTPNTEFANIKYSELLLKYNNITIIGYAQGDNTYINPDNNSIITKQNDLIVISESEKAINTGKKYNLTKSNVKIIKKHSNIPLKEILILGWNNIGDLILKELSKYVNKGVKQNITIVPDISQSFKISSEFKSKLSISKDLNRDIEDYNYLSETLFSNMFDSVIILSDNSLDKQEADIKNIKILHFIRDIEKNINTKKDKKINIDIVCQLLDEKNQELVNDFHKNDFVISAKLASLFFSQISKNPRLLYVFNEIFSEKGSEIYLKNIRDYIEIKISQKVKYADIVKAVALHNETTIGIEFSKTKKTLLNIAKDKELYISKDDRVILLEQTEF